MRKLLMVSLGCWSLAAAPAAAREHGSPLGLQVVAGIGGAFRHTPVRESGLELELPAGEHGFYPVAGFVASEDGSAHYYLCVARSLQVGSRLTFSASTGVAVYNSGGEGLRLGGKALFRTGLELGAQVTPRVGLAIKVYHLSNAGMRDDNPGTESVSLGLRFTP